MAKKSKNRDTSTTDKHQVQDEKLAGSDLSIKQIAADVGFANRYHFSRAFKAHTSISPARYRKEISGGRAEKAAARKR